jgi:hypothetical protein
MANDILDKKDKKILEVLKEYPEGIRQKTICKLTGLKERTCYNHLKKLEDMNILKNLYPIWKIWQSLDTQEKLAKLSDSNKNTEGHRIWWILPLVKKPFWWNKRKDRLMNLKGWVYKKEVTARNNIYFQIENDYMEIQTFKNSIYFICKEKYIESTDFEVFNKAKNDVINAIRYLEERFRFRFLAENEFHLTLVDNHYVTMKETLAEHYYNQGKTFKIEVDGYTLWIDLSDPKGLEGDNIEVKRRYLEIVKDYAGNPLLPLPSEIHQIQKETSQNLNILVKVVNDMTENQKELPVLINKWGKQLEEYAEQNKSHLALIQSYAKENISWRKKTEKQIRKELKDGKQTKLGEFL